MSFFYYCLPKSDFYKYQVSEVCFWYVENSNRSRKFNVLPPKKSIAGKARQLAGGFTE